MAYDRDRTACDVCSGSASHGRYPEGMLLCSAYGAGANTDLYR